MGFIGLTLSQMDNELAFRSEQVLLFLPGLWSNHSFLVVVILTIALLQMAMIYIPAFTPIFKAEPRDLDKRLLRFDQPNYHTTIFLCWRTCSASW